MTPAAHSKPWSAFDVARLAHLCADEKDTGCCATVLGRTPDAVRAAKVRLFGAGAGPEGRAKRAECLITAKLSRPLYDEIGLLAAKQGRSRSSLIRRALLKYLEDARV